MNHLGLSSPFPQQQSFVKTCANTCMKAPSNSAMNYHEIRCFTKCFRKVSSSLSDSSASEK